MNIFINGFQEIQENRPVKKIINPADGELITELHQAGADDGEHILAAAEEGFSRWSGFSMLERAEILEKYAQLLNDNKEEIAQTECRDMGKIIRECRAEVETAIALTKGYVEKAKHLYGHVISQNQKGLEHDLIFTRREPLGIILCIVPFNYPVELFTHKVIAALIMGNSVIVKLPSQNPMPLFRITELLVEAGVPASAVSLVFADREFVRKNLIKSSRIQAVSLTGSTQAGIDIFENSSETLHRLFLELGGNDPLIIFEDADLDYAVEEIVNSRLSNTGQICCASKRFLVHESIADDLVERLKVRLDKVKMGNPIEEDAEMGCIISEKAASAVMEQIQKTIKQGAECVYGGSVCDRTFVHPTILVNVTRNMDIASDMEVFGPVIPIITFKEEEEAVEIANQSIYGLEASIITKDLPRALKVAELLQAGTVVVNGAGSYRHMDLPFGGYKMSGLGREGISTTLEEFSQEKSYVIKKIFNR